MPPRSEFHRVYQWAYGLTVGVVALLWLVGVLPGALALGLAVTAAAGWLVFTLD